jgi:hypothetical protein
LKRLALLGALIALATLPASSAARTGMRARGPGGQGAPHASLATGTLGSVADPLTANGFTSPSCTTATLLVQLTPAQQRNCAISGVAVAPVPLSNYGFDTNIASGLDASFDDDLDDIVQGLLVTPVWTALVWLVHVVIVALEWCYSINLLAPSMLTALAGALGNAERIFTEPWLGLALACAGVVFAWHGLVRRRVAETLGQAVLTLAMMSVGLWIIADPVGTVGAVSNLADQAALATASAAATGNVTQPAGGLDDALGEVFDTAVTGPWCFLEFGDVDWCLDPSRLDARLLATAHELQQIYTAGATCHGPAPGLVQCLPSGSAEQRDYAAIGAALSAARTNGALFLALPAGGLARNALASQTAQPTLYGTLCGASNPTACTAGTAPQAQFRTAQGTWPRAGGLLLIAIGLVGMLALLAFIALRLLGAALALLIYLMLAPLAVLAPAFGDSGRDTFRHWFVRLIGAALAKLVYSVMLGIALLIANLLSSLEALGWWTQWLLVSVFWWLAFEHRHRMLTFVVHERSEPTSRLALLQRLRYEAQALRAARRTAGATAQGVTTGARSTYEALERIRKFPRERVSLPSAPTRRIPNSGLRAQVERSLEGERATPVPAPVARAEIARLTTRRQRLAREETTARRAGDTRRAISLALRGRAVDSDIASQRLELAASGRTRPGHIANTRATRARRRLLDREALADKYRRDYPRLAGLAGLSQRSYERSTASERFAARAEIERQLAQRRRWLAESGAAPAGQARQRPTMLGRRERQFSSRLR